MPNYYSPTVIQQIIPDADITKLELLFLSNIFTAERDGDGWYFFAEDQTENIIVLERAELEAALAASSHIESAASAYAARHLADYTAEAVSIDFDLSTKSWEWLFQDIVRRSATLSFLTSVTSYCCSKMRSDGFGGLAVLITADQIKGKSTDDILFQYLNELLYGPIGTAPGSGEHILLRLAEEEVRAALPAIIESDTNLTALMPEAIADEDVREGCLVVAERIDVREERDAAIFRAAIAAIRLANLRITPPDL